jgi:hypothetical protein
MSPAQYINIVSHRFVRMDGCLKLETMLLGEKTNRLLFFKKIIESKRVDVKRAPS